MDIAPKAPDVSVEEISLVFLGDFNPKIFHPMWFAHHGLLRDVEAEDAQIEVVHQDVAAFVASWLSIQVLRDRFTARTKADAYAPHLGDLVQSVFSKLSHSPVKQLGINVLYRLRFASSEDWHAFGHFVAPKSPWHEVALSPGLRSIHMQVQRGDDHPGFMVVSIEPDLAKPGDLFIRINDHYEIPQVAKSNDISSVGARWAVDVLQNGYKASTERSKRIVDQLIGNFLNTKKVDAGGRND